MAGALLLGPALTFHNLILPFFFLGLNNLILLYHDFYGKQNNVLMTLSFLSGNLEIHLICHGTEIQEGTKAF